MEVKGKFCWLERHFGKIKVIRHLCEWWEFKKGE